MRYFFTRLPWGLVIALCLLLGFAPFIPRPHIVDKFAMLFGGELTAPMDIFDLLYHGSPFILLLIKSYFTLEKRQHHD